jgi:hypothetical protein
MALTVKTIKKKPLSLKQDDAVNTETSAMPEGIDSSEPAHASAPASGKKAPQGPQMKQPTDMFSGICSILIFFIFVAILILMWLEWDFYHNPLKGKNAFPEFGISASAPVSAPAATATPAAEAPAAAETPAATGDATAK